MKLIMIRFTALCLLVLAIGQTEAQNVYRFSLTEAVGYAMENNYDVIYSEKSMEAAKQQMREATSIGLPKIDGSIDYTDNIQRPTSLLPGEFIGKPGEYFEIQFGTKYNVNAGLYASQLLFSGKYIVGLKTAKIFLEKTSMEFFQNKVAVRQQVANSYYNVLSTEEALRVLDTTLRVTRKLAEETRSTYEVGFVEDIDVDQLDLLVADLEASKVFFENQLNITHAFLKFYLGLTEQDTVILSDDLNSLIEKMNNESLITETFDYRQNVDYATLEKQKEISYMQVKLQKSEYMPTLMANINLKTNAQRDTWDFFYTGGKWFASSALGISLQMPIWSSGQRRAKVKQAQIAFDQLGVREQQLITSLNLQYQNARNEYLNAYTVYMNKDKARKVAQKIFDKTSVKFTEGMATSLDILNTQTQYLNAEKDYINAAAALLKAGEDLKKLLTKSITP
jgi:outer membrane protein TolC